MDRRYLASALVFASSLALAGCPGKPDCEKLMKGTWTGGAMGFAFESSYDFSAGKTSMIAMGKAEEKPLSLVKCSKDIVVFSSGGKNISATVVDDSHITIAKPGGLSLAMTKKSNEYTKFVDPPRQAPPTRPAAAKPPAQARPPITSLDAENVKQDLSGYKNEKLWYFDNPAEIRQFRIEQNRAGDGSVSLDVFMVLQSDGMAKEGRSREATATMLYEGTEGAWTRKAITNWKVSKKSAPPP